ncbi:MAG: c-type cytochrome biogenesis protein CcmF, partial [Magnetococcales bacterium]|nr:c-type cytochrome biogenesis protein CcmF [Magnetococcales bacterium]
MWIELAHFATIVALMLSLLQVVAPVAGVGMGRPVWIRVGRHAALMIALLLTLAALGIIFSFLNHDFSVKYVA